MSGRRRGRKRPATRDGQDEDPTARREAPECANLEVPYQGQSGPASGGPKVVSSHNPLENMKFSLQNNGPTSKGQTQE